MKVNTVSIEVPVTFRVLYSNIGAATIQQCQSIERCVDQALVIEIPEEIAGLMNNLRWSKTLGLRVVINVNVGVDRDEITSKQGSEGKSIREKLHL